MAATCKFYNSASVEIGTIDASGKDSYVHFHDTTTEESATLTASGEGSSVAFYGYSTGGNASVALTVATSLLDISSVNASMMRFGSPYGRRSRWHIQLRDGVLHLTAVPEPTSLLLLTLAGVARMLWGGRANALLSLGSPRKPRYSGVPSSS